MKDGLQAMSERSIFLAALDISDAAQQTAYLDQACGSDVKLRQHIEELISAQVKLGSFLGRPHIDVDATADVAPIAERPGSQIGPYKLLQTIGEGGMGVVFMADQQQPVRRKVALKVLKAGMDTRQVIARFEAERQALALMDHPNIARVLDAGETASGRPYFVMELVKGIPITQFCDENQLTTRQRLELFLPVCQAIQHAHQKGIIHRDIKPSNILVAEYDQQPVPKVIDFGVAKATGQELTEKTMFTALGQIVGTLEYMSPEQAKMNQLDIDTRSDIYSLGVLLYELLTGTTPFDKQRLSSAAIDEILRIIREEEPPCPSTRLSTINTLATVAAKRKTEPGRLRGLIRGELDWIVMKALEKDRNRRYETVNSLGTDIQRYLHDEPVTACPPSLGYRLSKFSRRYKAPLAVAAGFVLLLLAGIAASTWQAVRATVAEKSRAISEKAARDSELIAARERDAAKIAQQLAIAEKNNALAAREELRETLYAQAINLVQVAAESRQYRRAAQLLDEQRPATGQPDLRGFEWHYWRRKLERGQIHSVKVPQLATFAIRSGTRTISRGGARVAAYVAPSDPSTEFGLLAVFDGVTGRELVPPFNPFPGQKRQPGVPGLCMTMSEDGTRLAAALSAITLGDLARGAEHNGLISIFDGGTGREIISFENPGAVGDMVLSADGSRLAVEYGENRSSALQSQPLAQTGVKIWDTSTGECLQTLPMLPWTMFGNRLRWSPDGRRLLRQTVHMDLDKTRPGNAIRELLQVVDVASGETLWEQEFTDRKAHDAWTWSPDGTLLVILKRAEPGLVAKGTVQLWDSYTGKALAILDRETQTHRFFNNVVFSEDGQRLAVASGANEIYVWDLPKLAHAGGGTPLHIPAPDLTLRHVGEGIQGLGFSAGGRRLHSVDAGGVLVTWDATAHDDTRVGPDSLAGQFVAAISADATKIALNVDGPTWMCTIWDLVNNQEVCRLKTPAARYARPVFSRDGRRVVLVSSATTPQEDWQIVIHDTQTGEVLNAIPVEKSDSSYRPSPILVFRPDGRQIAALFMTPVPERNALRTQLAAWNVETGEQAFSIGIPSRGDLWYSQDGASVIVAGTVRPPEQAAVFYDFITGQRQKSIPLPSRPRKSFFDLRHQMFGADLHFDFVLGDLATGQERLRLPGYTDVEGMVISPDGSRLVLEKSFPGSGDHERELTLWNLKTGKRLMTFNLAGSVSDMSFSPDGNRLIVAVSSTGATAVKPIQIFDATPLREEAAK